MCPAVVCTSCPRHCKHYTDAFLYLVPDLQISYQAAEIADLCEQLKRLQARLAALEAAAEEARRRAEEEARKRKAVRKPCGNLVAVCENGHNVKLQCLVIMQRSGRR